MTIETKHLYPYSTKIQLNKLNIGPYFVVLVQSLIL